MTEDEEEKAIGRIQERFAAYLKRKPAAVIAFPERDSGANPAGPSESGSAKVAHLLDCRIWPKLLKNYDTEWLEHGMRAYRYREFSLKELNCTREQLVDSARRLFCECLGFSKVISASPLGGQGTAVLELPEAEYSAKKSDILEYVRGAKSERNR